MSPLDGIRVVDLSRVVSGPYCTMTLADMGADVIKIEEPGRGDESRAFGPPFLGGESPYFLSINRNKRSCTVNLKCDDGRAILQRLVARRGRAGPELPPRRRGAARPRLRRPSPRATPGSSTARSPGSGTPGPMPSGPATT